jgi:hypothetical protein
LIVGAILSSTNAACSGFHSRGQVASSPDGDIYAAVIQHSFVPDGSKPVLVRDSTTRVDVFAERAARRTDGIPSELVDSLMHRNDRVYPVMRPPRMDGVAVELVTLDEVRDLGCDEAAWARFRESRSGAGGYLAFSRVARSADDRTALVFTIWRCGCLCGLYSVFHLEREGAGWRVRDRIVSGSS